MNLPNTNIYDIKGLTQITGSDEIDRVFTAIGIDNTTACSSLYVKVVDREYHRVIGCIGHTPIDIMDLCIILPFAVSECMALYLALRERAKEVCYVNGCDIEHECKEIDIYAYINSGGGIIDVCGSDSWTGCPYPYSQIGLPVYDMELSHFIKYVVEGFDNWYEDNGYNNNY